MTPLCSSQLPGPGPLDMQAWRPSLCAQRCRSAQQQDAPLTSRPSGTPLLVAGSELNVDGKLLEEVRLQDSHVIQSLSTPVPLAYVQPPGEPAEPCAAAMLAQQASAPWTRPCCTGAPLGASLCPLLLRLPLLPDAPWSWSRLHADCRVASMQCYSSWQTSATCRLCDSVLYACWACCLPALRR